MNRKKEVNPLSLDKQYQLIAESILDKGVDKQDRTGTGTKSIFSAYVKHDMKQGFPLLTTKRVYWKAVVTELLWFLRGETNIKWLVENGNNIWVGDAYKNYCKEFEKGNAPGKTALVQRVDGKSMTKKLSKEEFIAIIKTDDEFSDKFGELGPIYGAQWRNWGGTFSNQHMNRDGSFGIHFKGIDQIQQAIHTLKTNPDSRRIIVSAWNVNELHNMVLPPCHWAFELYSEIDQQDTSKRKLSLKWHQRSVDLPLGLPFNIASYGLLLSIIAKEVGMKPDRLVGDLTNVHIYNNQVEGIEEQITRKPNTLPELVFKDPFWDLCDEDMSFSEKIKLYKPEWFTIEDYMPHPAIKFPLSN